MYSRLKDEGDVLLSSGNHEQALSKYFQAEHSMKKEMSLVREKCAQACLDINLFNDAFTHCCECIKLDRTNHKGYYRRAQALEGLLPGCTEYGCYMDVVKDYLKCYNLEPVFVEAFAKAVLVAERHGEQRDTLNAYTF